MRLIKGRDLETIIAEGVMEPGRAVTVIEQIASALHDAHQIGLVRRDVRTPPTSWSPTATRLPDRFRHRQRGGGESRMTNTGSVIGTWAYMAPERLSKGQADPRSNTYALRVRLARVPHGQPAVPRDKAGTTDRRPLGNAGASAVNPSARLTNRSLTGSSRSRWPKTPTQRYSTVTEMAAAARSAITQPMMPVTRPRGGGPVESDTQVVAIRPSVPQNSYPARSAGTHPTLMRPEHRRVSPKWAYLGLVRSGGHRSGGWYSGGFQPPPARTSQPRAKLPTEITKRRGIILASSIAAVVVVIGLIAAFALSGSGGAHPCDYGGWGEQWPLDRHLHADLRQEHRPDGRGRAGTGAARYRFVEIALGVCKQGVRGYRGEKRQGGSSTRRT